MYILCAQKTLSSPVFFMWLKLYAVYTVKHPEHTQQHRTLSPLTAHGPAHTPPRKGGHNVQGDGLCSGNKG